MTPARVVLVEDDPSLQRFVAMALEELPIDLQVCGSVARALALLHERPAALVITDLMLPDRSGLDLLAELVATPALRGQAQLVAFSAGLRPDVRARLAELGVTRLLSKPCSLAEIEACVQEALAPAADSSGPAADSVRAAATPDHPQQAAIDAAFGGNTPLYDSFRAACLRQFPADVETGEQACRVRDAAALRRLAHSLKSVLLSLGHETEAALARELEAQAQRGDWPQALPSWQRLRQQLGQLH